LKIRQKIALWITGAGVFVSLVFSIIVFLEMIEQPYRLIDDELNTIAQDVMRMAHPAGENAEAMQNKNVLNNPKDYWIKIFNDRMMVVYQSELTRYTDLPLYDKHSGYTIRTTIPKERLRLHQDKKNEVTFRVRRIRLPVEGGTYIVQIGKPIEKLDREIYDITKIIAFGLLTAMLLLAILSYFIAGKVLKPIGVIERLAREINDKNLSLRIPLGKNRDELYRLSESLNRMFDRLESSFETQKQFLASASHELKSPLALLQLSMEDCIQQRDLPDSLRHPLLRQTNILRRMSRLVKNLLDLSALELKQRFDLKEINLAELLKSVLREYEVVFSAKKIDIQADMPPKLQIKGDWDNLQRAIINLVDNAVKYNREGGEIRIKVAGNKSGVQVSLFNTGAGIPKADLGRVFEQFYRVEKSRSTQYGGSGLGLSIAKRIIELHGGGIEIESEASAWTQVNIFFPYQDVVTEEVI
jgi:two-component system, OmpR family, sensor kinase